MKKKVKRKKLTKAEKERRKIERAEIKKEQEETSVVLKIIGIIFSIFIAIFVALSLNTNFCGQIGDIIKKIIILGFGTFGHLIPIIIIVAMLISLFNNHRKANVKIYALFVLYFSLILLFAVGIINYDIEGMDLGAYIELASKNEGKLTLDPNQFSAGAIFTSISYVLYKAIGKGGSLALYSAIGIIALIILLGLSISKYILRVLKAIFTFVPNLIMRKREESAESLRVDIDNENILKKAVENSKNVNLEVKTDKSGFGDRFVLEPLVENDNHKKSKYLDSSKLNITSKDVLDRFHYEVEDSYDENKEKLLEKMQTKSINEILGEDKTRKATDFFYDNNMKPIDELDLNIPKIQNPFSQFSQNSNNNVEKEEDLPYNNNIGTINDNEDSETTYVEENSNNANDNDKFARGLDDLQKETNDIDINKATPDEILDTKEDIVVKNRAVETPDKVNIPKRKKKVYKFPPLNYLNRSAKTEGEDKVLLDEKANILIETLKQFGVGATVTNVTVGPSVTRFEVKPDLGVKVAKILSLEDDIKLALAATEIRIEAPIPGKAAIGIEIPNSKSSSVNLGDIIYSSEFRNAESKLTVAIGKDISGKIITADLRKMPHLLIAGATGSGKSVCVNSLITSIIYKATPDEVRLIMVDPKVVELQVYEGLPHLLIPVVTNPKKAASALNWAVAEMTRRYNLIQEKRVRDIESYNKSIENDISKLKVNENGEADYERPEKLPYLVIIIDEFADLMMIASKDVENSIMRIAQLARACGIYLVIATQRPSVNVISGSIKTNVPSRISFAVASGIDSQTILDRRGAEKLLGHGDMLYFPQGKPEPTRVQGCFVSEEEILKIVSYVKDDTAIYDENIYNAIDKGSSSDSSGGFDPNEKDEMFYEAGKLAIEQGSISAGLIQRHFRMGFNRAARIVDQLTAEGVVSKQDGKKPREILLSMEEFDERFK